MDRHFDKIRVILAMCLTVLTVGMARAELPDRSSSADLHETTGGQSKVRVGD
jgi:hypothetical protein